MNDTVATTGKNSAADSLVNAAERNRKIATNLLTTVSDLSDHLLGPTPTAVDSEKKQAMPSGLVFRVSGDIQETNLILEEVAGTLNNLCRELGVGRESRKAV